MREHQTWCWFDAGRFGRGRVACLQDRIVRVELPNGWSGDDVFVWHKDRMVSSGMVVDVAGELSLYYEGRREPRDLSYQCDPSAAINPTKFRLSVLAACSRIPRGEWLTYGQLARSMKLDPRRYSRAIGQVMARNPLPLIYPCHRVLSDGGRLGNYGGGLDMKQHLLLREGASGFRD